MCIPIPCLYFLLKRRALWGHQGTLRVGLHPLVDSLRLGCAEVLGEMGVHDRLGCGRVPAIRQHEIDLIFASFSLAVVVFLQRFPGACRVALLETCIFPELVVESNC